MTAQENPEPFEDAVQRRVEAFAAAIEPGQPVRLLRMPGTPWRVGRCLSCGDVVPRTSGDGLARPLRCAPCQEAVRRVLEAWSTTLPRRRRWN